MSPDRGSVVALLPMAAGPALASAVGMPAEGQTLLSCAAFVYMARVLRLVTPLAFVVAALAAVYDLRALRRRST
jgi:hypothetical protein